MNKTAEKMQKLRSEIQKRTGLILIGLGAFLALFILIFFYFQIVRIPGFPEFLPAKQTAIYAEFPNELSDSDPISKALNDTFKLNWSKEVGSWGVDRSAIALIKDTESKTLIPYVFIKAASTEDALIFFRKYQNPVGSLKEYSIDGIRAYSAPNLHFVFLSGVCVISTSQENLTKFINLQSGFTSYLGGDTNFKRTYEKTSSSYYVYAQPDLIPRDLYYPLAKAVPQMPILLPSFSSMGIGATKKDNQFFGKSFGILHTKLEEKPSVNYRAALLPFLPDEFSLLIAGNNIAAQLSDLDELFSANVGWPAPTKIALLLANTYLPNVGFVADILPLIQGEFASILKEDKFLLITDLTNVVDAEKKITSIADAFKITAGRFTPKLRDVILPDGSGASELVPDPTMVKTYNETFNNIQIKGFIMNDFKIYYAVADSKWFISNKNDLLKSSLLLTKGQGTSIRDSNYYKKYLQPILKNPELLGISILPQGVFSFSKQMKDDVMETNFTFGTL